MQRVFDSHVRHLLDRYRPKTILEIGVLRGANTRCVLDWCSRNGARLTSLDPVRWEGDLPEAVKQPLSGYKYKRGQPRFDSHVIMPEPLVEAFRLGLDRYWTCLKLRSLNYFESTQAQHFDLYLIDGDHNYYTVSRELEAIHRLGKAGDVVLFNDVVGACARRDQYYDPSFIPPEYVGGRRQGVLTAIEDFLDGVSGRRLWWRVDCPYTYRLLTKRHEGLGLMERRRD